ncbi:MAG: heterodisulfide reductase subunit E, partial [Nitrospirae bacterium]
MAESRRVEPDLTFIKELTTAGGDTLKKCFQCATCSIVCPISPDDKPFPRKEMIWAQWGMKDRLVKDPDVWLCHHCGDCTAYCPRGAKPGEVMGAIRKASVEYYAPIKAIAKAAGSVGGMIVLLIIPVVILLAMLAVNGTLHIPEGKIVYSKMFPQLTLVDPVFISAALFAIISAIIGIKKFWADITTEKIGVGMPLGESIKSTIAEILAHSKFKECGENKNRLTAHRLVFWSFVGLFIVTNSVLVIHWLHEFGYVHYDTPLLILKPTKAPVQFLIKLLANVSAAALFLGCILMIGNRMQAAEKGVNSTFNDWALIFIITTVCITGILSEVIRLLELKVAYVVY